MISEQIAGVTDTCVITGTIGKFIAFNMYEEMPAPIAQVTCDGVAVA